MKESLSCLRFAKKAKNIKNKAVVNVDASSQLVRKLQGEVKHLSERLRDALVSLGDGTAIPLPVPATRFPAPTPDPDNGRPQSGSTNHPPANRLGAVALTTICLFAVFFIVGII